MINRKILTIFVLSLGLAVWQAKVSNAVPMGTAWTYQGRLIDANNPADGLYDFQFKLFDDPCTGAQQGGTVEAGDLDVIDGYFTVELDFGSDVFNGDYRWLEIDVRPGDSNDSDAFVSLSPRQEITPVPYALQTRGIFVDNSGNVGIGTTSPEANLHVKSIAPGIQFEESDADDKKWHIAGYNSGFTITETAVGDWLYIATGGNVGIGTMSPGAKLDVAGNIGVSGTVDGVDISAHETNPNAHHSPPTTLPPSGPAGGDLSGSYPSPSVINDSHTHGDSTVSDNISINNARLYAPTGYGNVGIGTMNPSTKLHLDGQSLWLTGGNGGGWPSSAGAGLRLYHDGSAAHIWAYDYQAGKSTNIIFQPHGGNVGIGTSTPPTEKLDVEGNIDVSGYQVKNYRGFPRPDYDSGWQYINEDQYLTLTHSLGGNVDNYVVDMQSDHVYLFGINNEGHGGDYGALNYYGIFWRELTTSQIKVKRQSGNLSSSRVRIRIWVYD